MRIVFIGTVDFSLSCLQSMLERKARVVGVFTQSREQARFNADWADLSPLCRMYQVPVFHFHKISDPETMGKIHDLRPEIIFVLGFSQLLPPDFLCIPPMGVIGSHPSLLPENRGRHPLIWALVKGLKKSGLTLFYIDEGVDSGDIAQQREFPIEITDTAKTLYEKIKRLGAEMVRELIISLEKGEAARIPQDHSKATYLRKRNKEDGLIHWEEGSLKAYNLIRALTLPYVGAHTFWKGKEIKIWGALPPGWGRSGNGQSHEPGEIISAGNEGLAVWAQDDTLLIKDLEIDPEKFMVGEVLGNG
jgi:methionyl-tRNA formyltransferase